MNPGGGACSELRSGHCTPAWAAQRDSVSKKKKRTLTSPCLVSSLLSLSQDSRANFRNKPAYSGRRFSEVPAGGSKFPENSPGHEQENDPGAQ